MTGGEDELSQLLGRAGLEIVTDRRIEDVLPPRVAWRPLVSVDTEPAHVIRDDRPDALAEINRQWHRLAVEHHVIGEDGEFLIHVSANVRGSGGRRDRWTRVRLAAEWDLAGVLGDRPGEPEFVTLSTDGGALLGATCEEYEVADR
ncbi:hypothetical protein [Streptomyces sp. MST-110588]|uniref:hypothetical protein n=1 Tax=Streptomyces sp. MST-110588 TaxID=2833628 RepID=UPI001F5D6495|nr:hypothetical protein [Streptomyces sp. MST-110588]